MLSEFDVLLSRFGWTALGFMDSAIPGEEGGRTPFLVRMLGNVFQFQQNLSIFKRQKDLPIGRRSRLIPLESKLRMKPSRLPASAMVERLPWPVRALLGCFAACLGAGVAYGIEPFRAFPLLLAFPTVILSCWFLGMWGGAFCALTEILLVDSFLTKAQFRFSIGNATEEWRLAVFVGITLGLGWGIRRLSRERALLSTQELEQRLMRANAERQLAEERATASDALRDRDAMLQIALESNGMALWVWDVKKGAIHWSEEKYRMIGLEPGAVQPSTEVWLAAVHPEDADAVRKSVMATRNGGAADYHNQYRVVWPDGSVHWLESQGKCERDDAGKVERIVGVVADVTRRKRTEEALMRTEKLAIAGRLAASIAHEINNPLEAVSNLLFLVTLAETAETAQAHAHRALEQLMRVSLITQQTLKFHRQTGSPKSTLLSEVLESVLVLFRSKLVAADIAVEVRAERELSVDCMPSETQQIFANLVANAIDAMPQSGRLVIRLRPSRAWRDPAIEGMRVTFVDSGVGMNRATLRRTFEPFFTTKTETGTGLGMWVVAQLVERHHGEVRVWSTQRPGRSGTAFSVFLPFQGAPETSGAAVGDASETDAEAVSAG
jgi:PAS domain S-box-containing protein